MKKRVFFLPLKYIDVIDVEQDAHTNKHTDSQDLNATADHRRWWQFTRIVNARARSHTLTRTHVKETTNEVASQEIIGININTFAL